MRLKLKNRSVIPYGGQWYYKDPHSGQEFRWYQFDVLVDKIRAHRQANNYPVGLEFEQEIENQVCINHPEEAEPFDPRIPRKRKFVIGDIIRGTSVMMQHWIAGSPLVERSEAERRAQICKRCTYNDDFSKPCSIGICGELKNVVSSIVNHQGTVYDKDLKACQLCGCFLQAAIWLPLEVQCTGVTPEMKEAFKVVPECWKQCE